MSLEDKSFQPSSPPPTSSSLSAFKDFQTAWSQRFPDCDIPSRAWEEDVRTNLDKHRQKVAQLRDELEKEEFYVAYLKKLLDDATESKETEIGLTREESTTISSESTRSSPLSSANLLNQSNSRAINLSPCSSGSSSSINREERPLRKDVSCNPTVHSKSPDQYVTVIKVSSQGESDRFTPEQPCQTRSAVNNHLKNSNFTPSLTRDKDDGQVSGAPRQSSIEKSDKDTTAQNNETGHLPSSYSAHRSDADDDTKVSRRRRPPTPPRKPKINRSKLPGYPFRSPSSDNDDSSTHNIMSSSTTSLSSCDFYGHPSKPLIGTPPEYRNDQSQAVKPSLGSCSAKSTSIITIQPYSPVGSNSWGERGSNESRGMRKPSSFHRPSQPSSSYSEKSASKISGFSERCTATPSCSSTSSLERAAESFSSLEPEISKSSDVNDAYNREDRDNYDIDTTPSKEFLEPHLRDLIDSETQSSPHQKEDAYDLTYDVVADNDAQNTRANDSEDEAVSDEEEDIYDTVAPDEVSVEDFNAERCEDDFSRPPFRPSRGLSDNLTRDENSDHLDPNSFANYVNIDYFLRREETSSKDESDNEAHFLHSMSSDHDLNLISSGQAQKSSSQDLFSCSTYDEVFVPEDEDHKFSASNSHSDNFGSQEPEDGLGNADDEFITEAERCNMYKSILSSIIDSETVYVDCLFTLIQYRKALKSTTESSHPLLSTMDLDAIFYKIQDLYEIHTDFLNGVKKLANSSDSTEMPTLGDLFKVLASRLEAYSAYLKNYSLALETVQRCSSANNQFSEITRAIKLKSLKSQSVTLEELLHKPVARVQKNALILHDLLKYSRKNSHEYRSLRTALKMTQCFLNELNIAATEQMFPVQDKTQRRVVKDSCVIEGSESRRKLRHLFLFNDTLVCAKYKPSTRQKPACDLKWHALLSEISLSDSGGENKIFHAFCASLLVSLETNTGHKEKEISSEIRNLKSKVSSIRDVILKEKSRSNTKMVEKLKKKLNEHERQLALILPQLPFVISLKNGRAYTFYLSSEFDRTQWIESIKVLQQSLGSVNEQVNLSELQAWIDACKIEKGLNTSLWSYLMPCNREEDALHGELHLTLKTLRGFSEPTKIFIAMEVDTYGHFFQRATTRTVCDSEQRSLGQDFTLDLDGSSHLRFICYEESNSSKKPILRGKTTLELGSSWLKDKILSKELIFPGCKLSIDLKYISLETSPMRFPAGKVYGAFGVPISQVTKKEKSNVPYLIVGCVKEVERRGMKEVGVYRVSGLSSDIQRLKKGFETNPYEVEHLLKEIDIHAITGLLKMYLRELPEALFTNLLYKKFFDAFSLTNQEERKKRLIELYFLLPPVNMHTINFLIDHLVEVNRHKDENRMTLHNLATVIGPTLIRPGSTSPPTSSGATNTDTFTAGTIDVMAQAGILYFFLKRKTVELPGNA